MFQMFRCLICSMHSSWNGGNNGQVIFKYRWFPKSCDIICLNLNQMSGTTWSSKVWKLFWWAPVHLCRMINMTRIKDSLWSKSITPTTPLAPFYKVQNHLFDLSKLKSCYVETRCLTKPNWTILIMCNVICLTFTVYEMGLWNYMYISTKSSFPRSLVKYDQNERN